MWSLLYSLFLSFILSFILVTATTLIKKKSLLNFEKSSPFECGFNPKMFLRTPFSIQFFLVALLFLIFDVELILLFPFLMKNFMSMNLLLFFFISSFFILLFLGLYHEWNQNSLQWSW